MNTSAIVEEWEMFQDKGSIDWSGFPAHHPAEFAAKRVGLFEEFQHQYELPSGAAAWRFGFPADNSALEDDDPE
jgi:hypothetical protein